MVTKAIGLLFWPVRPGTDSPAVQLGVAQPFQAVHSLYRQSRASASSALEDVYRYAHFLFSQEGEQPERLFYGLGHFSSVLLEFNGFNRWLN